MAWYASAISFQNYPGSPYAFFVGQLKDRGFHWDTRYKVAYIKAKLSPEKVCIIGAILEKATHYLKDVVINAWDNDVIEIDHENNKVLLADLREDV